MRFEIRNMGNSQGVLIPKPLLPQLGLGDTVDMQVRDGVIEIRPLKQNPREGWAQDSQRLAAAGADALVWRESDNDHAAHWVW